MSGSGWWDGLPSLDLIINHRLRLATVLPEELREPSGDPEEADGSAEEVMELLPDGNLAPHGWMLEALEKSQRTLAEQISMAG